ncbi:hypothetical protein [Maledivibacter halophilus]|nr:hypothetical protein [Maledivibacter halophilus]
MWYSKQMGQKQINTPASSLKYNNGKDNDTIIKKNDRPKKLLDKKL